MSQLDHTKAERPSGSIFKPFVYATALNGGLWNSPNMMTTSSIVDDDPKTFMWNGEEYNPHDMHKNWEGPVTLRTAFAKSLNVPAIEVAEQAGYHNVSDLAHKAGLVNVRGTPSMALGTYNVTAMDMAGAYTVFANDGVMVTPRLSRTSSINQAKTFGLQRLKRNACLIRGSIFWWSVSCKKCCVPVPARALIVTALTCQPRLKPVLPRMLGLPASLLICSASFGLGLTITKT